MAFRIHCVRDLEESFHPRRRGPSLLVYMVRHVRPEPAKVYRIQPLAATPAACKPIVRWYSPIINLDEFGRPAPASFAFHHEKASEVLSVGSWPLPSQPLLRGPPKTAKALCGRFVHNPPDQRQESRSVSQFTRSRPEKQAERETPGVPCGRGRELIGGIYSTTCQSSASMSACEASHPDWMVPCAVFMVKYGSTWTSPPLARANSRL